MVVLEEKIARSLVYIKRTPSGLAMLEWIKSIKASIVKRLIDEVDAEKVRQLQGCAKLCDELLQSFDRAEVIAHQRKEGRKPDAY